eukprot:scaffold28537_cov33-Tisochrysis_lutea.AAC.2
MNNEFRTRCKINRQMDTHDHSLKLPARDWQRVGRCVHKHHPPSYFAKTPLQMQIEGCRLARSRAAGGEILVLDAAHRCRHPPTFGIRANEERRGFGRIGIQLTVRWWAICAVKCLHSGRLAEDVCRALSRKVSGFGASVLVPVCV